MREGGREGGWERMYIYNVVCECRCMYTHVHVYKCTCTCTGWKGGRDRGLCAYIQDYTCI